MNGRLVDISQAGVGLVLRKSLVAGEVVFIELIPPVGRPLPPCEAEVRWVESLPDGSCRVGCGLEHRLSYAEMQRFV